MEKVRKPREGDRPDGFSTPEKRGKKDPHANSAPITLERHPDAAHAAGRRDAHARAALIFQLHTSLQNATSLALNYKHRSGRHTECFQKIFYDTTCADFCDPTKF